MAATLVALAFQARDAHAVTVPSQFVVENPAPGVGFDTPVAMAFLPSGRMLVAEKRGRVYSVWNGVKHSTPMLSRENEVLNEHDRGFLGIAVDPNYPANRYVYFLYTVDPDSNGSDTNNDAFGRLVRYQVSAADSNVVAPSTRTVLMGRNWREGPLVASPSHTIGGLRFGRDGSLLVTIGDGGQYTQVDPGGMDASAFSAIRTDPYEDIGAFRAQYLGSLCGKLLRVNPANGHGYPSNPFYDGDPASVQSRVWAYGLRNPFRFTVRPGTGSTNPTDGNPGALYVGDVGWATWEEMNVAAQGGMNFGWPCYEGVGPNQGYEDAEPAHHGCETIGTPSNPSEYTPPIAAWHHDDPNASTPPGFKGNTSVGGVFYTGTSYPVQYRGQYFFADYGQDWIKVAVLNESHELQQVMSFATSAGGPVDLAVHPIDGDVYYVSVYGELRRIRFTGQPGNDPPVANAGGTPDLGAPPLVVDFSSAGSSDADNDPLTFSWNFGDGQGSSSPNPQHTYPNTGTFQAILTVGDGRGGFGRDTVVIVVGVPGSFPTTAVLDGFDRPNGALGSNWVDPAYGLSGVQVLDNRLAHTCCYQAPVWSPTSFSSDQEAYVTITELAAGEPGHDLMLKVQGNSWSSAHVEVRYDDIQHHVGVHTYTPGSGWVQRGGYIPATFVSGDQLGARAHGNGLVEVFRNGFLIGSVSLGDWPFASAGGRIGLTLDGTSGARFDDFGGGTTVLIVNTPPAATVLGPADGTFYVAGDVIALSGAGIDVEQHGDSLDYRWEVDIHHNTHVHPNSIVATGVTASYQAEHHDDGTGVHERIRLIVTDREGLRDTAAVSIYPEVDLEPSALVTTPSQPGTTAPATYRFKLYNRGRMLAPISRWRLVADATLLAEGDAVVPALDSLTVILNLPPALAAGSYDLRVALDSLAAVVETSETNNAAMRRMTVIDGPGPDELPPLFTLGPTVDAHAQQATIAWHTNEPTTGIVRWGPTPNLGDSVSTSLDSLHAAPIVNLSPSTLYFFQIVAYDTAANQTVAALDSFVTDNPPVSVSGSPPMFALSRPYPNPSSGAVALRIELPRSARVSFTVLDVQGRQAWAEPEREMTAGRWTLRWSGQGMSGARMPAGVYLARVMVDGRPYLRRIALVR
ncbi:MAG TPA: PQQ-dependent sugar dehydrogenase [Candidatus Limnocylindria bacterium]|nr:PQQ-dependent sugar dehydrogenase [Candidatus Limnocylindria bacterium]